VERNQKLLDGEGLLAVLKAVKSQRGGGGQTIVTGGDVRTYATIDDLYYNGTAGLAEGTEFKTAGYYHAGDGGGAHYMAKYLYNPSAYPWAIDMGEIEETAYEVVLKADGTPQTDAETGAYILKKDSSGNPIPLLDSAGKPKKKHLYACITDTTVNYAQFGAKLDGTTDDYQSIYLCHKYQHDNYTIEPLSERRHYYIRVENHHGIIHKDNNEPIQCCGNIDLSGSQLLVTDKNAAWYGFYLWGDNEEDYLSYEPTQDVRDTFQQDSFVIKNDEGYSSVRPNSLIFLKETPYAVRDDGGYLYSEPRYELLLHTMDGILSSPFTYDWTKPGGLEIQSTVSDYDSHATSASVVSSQFSSSYTRLPATHYHFIGCAVKLSVSSQKYCTVLWCKCHNAHISGFTFEPDPAQLHNKVFKNSMIYIWGCYNVEISGIAGFNAAGKKEGSENGTSGYVIRVTNCLSVHMHDISVQGYWGATAMNCVKDIHIERVSINRLDIHNYFYNLFIDQCNLYNHAIQTGEGRGIVQVTNSNFYVNKIDADSYPNAHLLEFNLTYGRIFEGSVLVQNCNVYLRDPDGNEFDVCKIEFSPEAVSTLPSYKFPEVTIRDCSFWSYQPDTYLVYFMIAGTRNCKTAMSGPTNITGYTRDTGNDAKGTLVWKYLGRGIDWTANQESSTRSVVKGQFIRTYKNFLDTDGKTSFYDYQYFLITQAGTLPEITDANKPTDTTGAEFTIGTAKAKAVDRHAWEANRAYSAGDYCFTENSSWFPLYCYECTAAGTSNGYRPVHTTGTVIEGIDQYPQEQDSCWWEHVGTMASFVTKTFQPEMEVESGDILYAGDRLYQVITKGKLKDTPPMDTPWLGKFSEGTATLSFIGRNWQPKAWWAAGAYCISYASDGIPHIYKLVKHDGITSGAIPIPGSGRVVDGDMIWQHTDKAATKQWSANTQFYKGDIVSHDSRSYQCIFDGRLELPHRTVLENIATNMKQGDVFDFWHDTSGGTDIPTWTDSTWRIELKDVEVKRFRQFKNGYFCHSGNPQPIIIDSTHAASDIKTVSESSSSDSGGSSSGSSGNTSGDSSGTSGNGGNTSGGGSSSNTPADSGTETDVSSMTRLDTYTGSADASGKISAYTFTKFKTIPNNTTVHFKAVLFCPTGVSVGNGGKDYAVSDFATGRAWGNANQYSKLAVKTVTGGTNYILDWDEAIAVKDTDKVTEDDLAKGTVTYYCCTEINLTGDSTQYKNATLTVSAYKP
jgi:uncharacterized membrane protein YgcG